MSVETFELVDTKIQLASLAVVFSSLTTCRNDAPIAKIMPAFCGVLKIVFGLME
jgi:hypothetical protein